MHNRFPLIPFVLAASFILASPLCAGRIDISFEARVGDAPFHCGQTYPGVGRSASTILPRDFRFYIHNIRLISGRREIPVDLLQDGLWQLDDTVLLDFEDGRKSCLNGNPMQNHRVLGSVPDGQKYRGLRFTLGVPFPKNHLDINRQPPPFNLTALYWGWNGGYKFARLDFAIPGQQHGFLIHLGSTGCRPDTTVSTSPSACSHPNRAEVYLPDFDPATGIVVADLAALLLDLNLNRHDGGCMSEAGDASCAPIFFRLGLPFGGRPSATQSFFHFLRRSPTQ